MVQMGTVSATFTTTFLLLITTFLIYSVTYNGHNGIESDSLKDLILLQVLCRHGNRTPYRSWPTDEHMHEDYYPFGHGQLTTGGKAFEHKLGVYIGNKYRSFLGHQYTSESLVAKHTNKERTIMSAELVLAGVYPPTYRDIFSSLIYWQPIPIWDGTASKAPYQAYENCPNYEKNVDRFLKSDEVLQIRNKHLQTFNRFEEFTGVKNATFLDLIDIYISLQAQHDYGFALPQWTNNLTMGEMEDVGAIFFELCSSKLKFQRLMEGYLLKEIIDNALGKANGTLPKGRKFYLFSGHDVNVASMLHVLNVWYRHQPPSGAAIFFEVHNIDNIVGFKIYYQDYKHPKLLTIPGCESFCPIERFSFLLKDKIPLENDTCNFQID